MLNKKLDEYLSNNYYPFHMPGHKRQNLFNSSLPYGRDLTEIRGFDNLNDPEDIFVDIENKISEIYEVEDSIISVNGSTAAILSAIRSLTYNNKNILIQRSSHKSVYNAIELNKLSPNYLSVVLDNHDMIVDVDMANLSYELNNNNYAAVVLTSPSYEGYRLDLKSIYSLCKKNNTPLILDMAHGSHELLDGSYDSKVFDIAITSFHKNLSALTPSAAMLINNKSYTKELRRNMAIFQSSSPSYIILQSIDEMINHFNQFYKLRQKLNDSLDKIYNLNLDNLSIIDSKYKDRTKIVISTNKTNISGQELSDLLYEEKIEVELSNPTYVLLIASIFDTSEGFKRLEKSLVKIDKNLMSKDVKTKFSYLIPKKEMEIWQASISKKKTLDLDKSVGYISGQFVYAYPPGIPILAPGELIDEQILENIDKLTSPSTSLNIDNSISVIDWQKS